MELLPVIVYGRGLNVLSALQSSACRTLSAFLTMTNMVCTCLTLWSVLARFRYSLPFIHGITWIWSVAAAEIFREI